MDVMRIDSILWTVFGLVWLVAWLRTKRTQQRAPLSSRLLYAIPVSIGSYLMFSDNIQLGWLQSLVLPKNIIVDVLGISLAAAGIGLAIWARFYLGQNWSSAVSIKVGHQLIRGGPYAWVRHPIYSGILLAITGTALGRGTPVGLLSIAMFWLGFSIKSGMEEKFMLQTFGTEYQEYTRTTGALVPKLRV